MEYIARKKLWLLQMNLLSRHPNSRDKNNEQKESNSSIKKICPLNQVPIILTLNLKKFTTISSPLWLKMSSIVLSSLMRTRNREKKKIKNFKSLYCSKILKNYPSRISLLANLNKLLTIIALSTKTKSAIFHCINARLAQKSSEARSKM